MKKIKQPMKFWVTKYHHHCGFSFLWCRNGNLAPWTFVLQIGRTCYYVTPFNYTVEHSK